MPSAVKKVLITGAGGFLGSHLIGKQPDHWEVFGTTYTSTCNLDQAHYIKLDLGNVADLERVLDDVRPDLVIHTAAVSGESACRSDVDWARRINVASTGQIAKWVVSNGARMIFTSTDLVFEGRKSGYLEDDERHSEMVYGELKIEAEDLLAGKENCLIVRLPLMYGIGLGDRKGSLHSFIQNSKEGKPQDLFVDEFRSPLFVEDAAEYIWSLADNDVSGILHLGGPERLSRLLMGAAFSSMLHLDDCIVRPVSRADKHMDYRPADTSLDSSRALSMGFCPQTISEGLEKVRRDIESGLY